MQCIFIAVSHRDVSFTSSFSHSALARSVLTPMEPLAFIRRVTAELGSARQMTVNDPFPLQFAVRTYFLKMRPGKRGTREGRKEGSMLRYRGNRLPQNQRLPEPSRVELTVTSEKYIGETWTCKVGVICRGRHPNLGCPYLPSKVAAVASEAQSYVGESNATCEGKIEQPN